MASSVDHKVVIHHIVNGTLADNLCLICLKHVDELSEHILTRICKDGKEYCIADVLEQVCQIEFSDITQHRVCADCFITASAAYKFFLSAKRTQEILTFYTEELQQNMFFINTDLQSSEDSICIFLPLFMPNTQAYDLGGLAYCHNNVEDVADNVKMPSKVIKAKKAKVVKMPSKNIKNKKVVKRKPVDDSEIGIVRGSDNTPFLKPDNGKPVLLNKQKLKRCIKKPSRVKKGQLVKIKKDKVAFSLQPRGRKLLSYMFCSHCTMKYRRVAMLKEHMKTEHNIDLFVCKICRTTVKDADELENHLKTHTNTNTHICATCNIVFKKRETIILHLKKHEELQQLSMTGSHVCEVCKKVLADEEKLEEHFQKNHAKKFTCHYCGRLYRRQISLDGHLKKHEMQQLQSKQQKSATESKNKPAKKSEKRFHCHQCGGDFVNDKALMMHTRLHTNERPHICDVCGRGFVSVNRRNQHMKCAHSAPTHRCPLCPSLFHLRSMVNTHIKRAHLNGHKRGNRTSKYQDVSRQTAAVPITELSMSLQNRILELKAAQEAMEDDNDI